MRACLSCVYARTTGKGAFFCAFTGERLHMMQEAGDCPGWGFGEWHGVQKKPVTVTSSNGQPNQKATCLE